MFVVCSGDSSYNVSKNRDVLIWCVPTEGDEVGNDIGWCVSTKDVETRSDIGWCGSTKDVEARNDNGEAISFPFFL